MAVTEPLMCRSTRARRCSSCRPTRRDRHRAQRRAGGRTARAGAPRIVHYEDVRVPADHLLGGEGTGVRDRPDPSRRWAHPPRHAHRRDVQEGLRHDVRAGAQPRDAGRAAGGQAVGAGHVAESYIELQQFRLLVLHTAWPIDQYVHRQGPHRDRGRQGADARGAPRHRSTGRCICTGRSGSPTRCRSPGCGWQRRHGHRRRPDRGAQGHDRPPGAEGLPAAGGPLARASSCPDASPRPRRSSPTNSSTR